MNNEFHIYDDNPYNLYNMLKNENIFEQLIKIRDDKHIIPNMGMLMCLTAKSLGYKNIYLCGIDFYENGYLDYGIKCIGLKNLSYINNVFKTFKYLNISNHSLDFDKYILKYIYESGINIILLSGSETTKELMSNNIKLKKEENCLKDVIL